MLIFDSRCACQYLHFIFILKLLFLYRILPAPFSKFLQQISLTPLLLSECREHIFIIDVPPYKYFVRPAASYKFEHHRKL